MEIEIIDHSQEVIKAKNEAIEAALETIGGLMERYAKQNCPVDTGLLRNSITYCLDGQKLKMSYRATYGENKNAKGKRYGAGSKKAGSVGVGFYAGEMPKEPEGRRSVSVGTNVEYASIVEFNESAKHESGRAHFLRDSLANHISEYNQIFTNELKEVK